MVLEEIVKRIDDIKLIIKSVVFHLLPNEKMSLTILKSLK